jgi:hypothetical protein
VAADLLLPVRYFPESLQIYNVVHENNRYPWFRIKAALKKLPITFLYMPLVIELNFSCPAVSQISIS